VRKLPAFLLLAAGLRLSGAPPAFWDSLPEDRLIETMIAEMTEEELLGQVFFLGYVGTQPSEEILRWIAERHIGGVKVFTRNVDGLRSLAEGIRDMQQLSQKSRLRIPLFIATDQEGGWVHHIKEQASTTPGNLALGAGGLPRDAYLTGYYIGQELRALGINMNFAPTVDVYSNPEAAVIGPRAFSSDPVQTGLLSIAYMKGMLKSGIVPLAKHYPGHGHSDRDSHGALPIVRLSFPEMWERELLPYRMLIAEGLPGIMSGHLAFPDILGSLTPSSCSPFFMREVLRDRLGFRGIVVTDDLEMNAVLSGGTDTAVACRRALEAGNDMVLISHTPRIQEQAWRYLLALSRKDAQFRRIVRDSAARILRVKWSAFRRDPAPPLYPDLSRLEDRIPARAAVDFFQESSLRSVTLVGGERIPFQPEKQERVLLVGQFQEFLQEGKLRYPGARTFEYSYSPFYRALPEVQAAVRSRAGGFDTLIFCLANYNSLEVLKSLQPLNRRIIVISALTPVYLREVPWITSSIAVYGTNRESFRAGFAALAGDFTPEGSLPIRFDPGPQP
jgi:beta-N-acetylhexosaminidase